MKSTEDLTRDVLNRAAKKKRSSERFAGKPVLRLRLLHWP